MPLIPEAAITDSVNIIRRDKLVAKPPLSHAAFTLDSSGVAGFFGGESAVRAMATINFVPQRRWSGWYNAPGSYEIAKQYSPLAMSDIFDGLFPGGERNAAKILMVDGQEGPQYIRVHSPTGDFKSRLGHFGYLLARRASQLPTEKAFRPRARHTMDTHVTLVKLQHVMQDKFEQLNVTTDKFKPQNLIPSLPTTLALGTIFVSVGGCVACALIADWFSFTSIALGSIANGVACLIFGAGELILKHSIPANVESPGDIVLKSNTEIIVVIGSEGAVSPLTRARFVLHYHGTPELEQGLGEEEDQHTTIWQTCTPRRPKKRTRTNLRTRIQQKQLICASVTLLLFQFLAQLLLIPQGTLFGQLMFITTLITSWIYHSYLSSRSLDFQIQTLFKQLHLNEAKDVHRYRLNTWTEAVVFTCLALVSVPNREYHGSEADNFKNNIEILLDGLLPSKTDVWQTWKRWFMRRIAERVDLEREGRSAPSKAVKFHREEGRMRRINLGHKGQDVAQLRMYQDDADSALMAWETVRNTFKHAEP